MLHWTLDSRRNLSTQRMILTEGDMNDDDAGRSRCGYVDLHVRCRTGKVSCLPPPGSTLPKLCRDLMRTSSLSPASRLLIFFLQLLFLAIPTFSNDPPLVRFMLAFFLWIRTMTGTAWRRLD